jgi:phage terminase small subunit
MGTYDQLQGLDFMAETQKKIDTDASLTTKKRRTELSVRERMFCQYYIRLGNATEAYIQAGYTANTRKTASTESYRLLRKPPVCAEIKRLVEAAEAAAVADVAQVLDIWSKAAKFDPRELSQIRRGACRYCHGKNHERHWRAPPEFKQALVEWNMLPDVKKTLIEQPNDDGGYGYNRNLLPHRDCNMCDGEGHCYVHFPDSRGYSKEAATAFEGAAHTQSGIKVSTIDRLAASDKLAKFHGMYRTGDTDQALGGLASLIANIQERGSKAPLNGKGDAPVVKSSSAS